MKLSNEKIVNDSNILRGISQKQLPIKVSYAIAKNISKIDAELKIYNQELQKLLDKHAEKDTKGNPKNENGSIILKKDHIEDWNKELKELLVIENEIEIHKFNMSEFEGKTCDTFSPSEIMTLEYMIED